MLTRKIVQVTNWIFPLDIDRTFASMYGQHYRTSAYTVAPFGRAFTGKSPAIAIALGTIIEGGTFKHGKSFPLLPLMMYL